MLWKDKAKQFDENCNQIRDGQENDKLFENRIKPFRKILLDYRFLTPKCFKCG